MPTYTELFALLVLPLALLFPSSIPSGAKGLIIIFTMASVIFLLIKEKASLTELGLRTDNIKISLLPYGIFTLAGIIFLIFLAHILHKQALAQWWRYAHLQWAFLPISLTQEFVYRAFAQRRLQKATTAVRAILLTAILYSGIHIFWKDPLILAITFIGGIGWGYLWYKHPNLILVSLSHAILNFLIIYLGFFPWLITDFLHVH